MEWIEIAKNIMVFGVDADAVMDVKFKFPQNFCDRPATEYQIDAIERFTGHSFPTISFSQAHTFLSLREYARLCAKAILKGESHRCYDQVSVCLDAYASHHEEITKFAEIWSDRAYRTGASSPRVKDTPFYNDMCEFADHVLNEILNGGN